MYEIVTRNKRVEKKLVDYISSRKDILNKLERLKLNPRRECGAHPLKGKLEGKWSCWLGSNIRMTYKIDDHFKQIIAESIGTHNIY